MSDLIYSVLEKISGLVADEIMGLLEDIAGESKSNFKDKIECFIKNEIEKKNLRKEVEAYFKKYVENADLDSEFDFEAVTKYLFRDKERLLSIFFGDTSRTGRTSLREALINDAVARGGSVRRKDHVIRDYCNAVIDFIGRQCYRQIGNDSRYIITEIHDILEEYLKTNQQDFRAILRTISYTGSFAEYMDNAPSLDKEDSSSAEEGQVNLFSFRNPKIKFHGRKNECLLIDAFMKEPKQQLLWSITGLGGIGKSKLALHISQKYQKEGWSVLWLNALKIRKILDFHSYNYNAPILFVCDYAGEYVKELIALINELSESPMGSRVRFLLLERVSYNNSDSNALREVSWYGELIRSDAVRKIEYQQYSLNLNLKQYALSDTDYQDILDDFSGHKFKSQQKDQIIDFVKKLRFSNATERTEETSIRCLFLLFTADACLHGKDYRNWDAEDLMRNYIERLEDILRKRYPDIPLEDAFRLFAIATAMGAFSIEECDEGVRAEYASNIITYFHRNGERIKEFLILLCEKNKRDMQVTPMYPDLLGELLFVDNFSALMASEKKEWFSLLMSDDYWFNFAKFMERCLSDWIELKETKKIVQDMISMVSNKEDAHILAAILFDSTIEMPTAAEIMEAAKEIKALLKAYPTAEVAEPYAKALVNATVEMSTAAERMEAAEKIKELLKAYPTAEIAERYAKVFVVMFLFTASRREKEKIIQKIEEILRQYPAEEIKRWHQFCLEQLDDPKL